MPNLTCRDLQPGDLLLKFSDGGLVSKAIKIGQFFTGHTNSSVVHAGILFDKHYIIEAQSSGISANDLRVQNQSYSYLVFRPRQTQLGQGAATCAKMMFDIQHEHQTLKYDLPGAVKSLAGGGRAKSAASMDQLLDDILSGKGHPFFCSQFVVYVYQFVAAQCGLAASRFFPVSDAKVSPAALANMLSGHAGFLQAGHLPSTSR